MEPAQRLSGERPFYVVTFGKSFQPHLAKTIGPDGALDALRLRGRGDLVALAANDENPGAKKITAGTKFTIAFTQQIFVDPSEVKPSDAVARNREQGSNEAGALGAAGNTSARDGPLV